MLNFDEEEFICVMTEDSDNKSHNSGCLSPVMVFVVIVLVIGFSGNALNVKFSQLA
jgi:hypothetical protein